MDVNKLKLLAFILVPVLITVALFGSIITGVVMGVASSLRQGNPTCGNSSQITSWNVLGKFIQDGGCGDNACAVTAVDGSSGGAQNGDGLTESQVSVLKDILGTAKAMKISEKGQVIAVITALQESGLKNYANDGVYNPAKNPSDANYSSKPQLFSFAKLSMSHPHDAVGSDASSVGPFQQQAWWGTVGNSTWENDPDATMNRLMDPVFQSQKFFNSLISINGWESMDPATAAQTVQVSAFPGAYTKWLSQATSLVATYSSQSPETQLYDLGKATQTGNTGGNTSVCGSTGTGGLPLPKTDWYHVTAQWDQVRSYEHHPGLDIGCSAGFPEVYSMTTGVVVTAVAGNSSGRGTPMGQITIKLPDGSTMTYLHGNSALVSVGDTVAVGTPITNCASTGLSTGNHVHLQVNVSGSNNAKAKALPTADGMSPDLRDPALFMYEVYNTNICPPYVANRLTVSPGAPLPGGGYMACWA